MQRKYADTNFRGEDLEVENIALEYEEEYYYCSFQR